MTCFRYEFEGGPDKYAGRLYGYADGSRLARALRRTEIAPEEPKGCPEMNNQG
jgi:hypothetical protein